MCFTLITLQLITHKKCKISLVLLMFDVDLQLDENKVSRKTFMQIKMQMYKRPEIFYNSVNGLYSLF